jgi:hypothetical protein
MITQAKKMIMQATATKKTETYKQTLVINSVLGKLLHTDIKDLQHTPEYQGGF